MKKSALNVPNILSIIRVFLVPAFVASLLLMREIKLWGLVVPTLVFIVTALTDMLDGKIARKYNLVTDFGKFIDPLADKFMVIGSQIAIMAYMFITGEVIEGIIFMILVLLILLRELGVTSLRLVVAGNSGIVVAASIFGKIKTVSQMAGTVIIILEPILSYFPDSSVCTFLWENHVLAFVMMAIMAFTTVFSGLDYLKAYLPYIDTNK